MDIFKMSKIDFGCGGLAKKVKKVIVTIMLSFPFFDQKCFDANFFPLFLSSIKNDLGDFYVSIIMLKNANNLSPKSPKKFVCEKCDYICCKVSEYSKHLATAKHRNANNANKKISKISTCECVQKYYHTDEHRLYEDDCPGNGW